MWPQSIRITNPANKLNYKLGEPLDITGLIVMGTYSDGTIRQENISVIHISGFDSTKLASNQLLTIRVGESTTTYTVNVSSSKGMVLGASVERKTLCELLAELRKLILEYKKINGSIPKE